MARNLPWKVVRSVRVGGGRASLVSRRYRGRFGNLRLCKYHIPRQDRIHFAVIWEGNREEGFPALLAGGWTGQKKECDELFAVIRERALVELRSIREFRSGRSRKSVEEQMREQRAAERLFTVLSDASLEMKHGRFSVSALGDAGKVEAETGNEQWSARVGLRVCQEIGTTKYDSSFGRTS